MRFYSTEINTEEQIEKKANIITNAIKRVEQRGKITFFKDPLMMFYPFVLGSFRDYVSYLTKRYTKTPTLKTIDPNFDRDSFVSASVLADKAIMEVLSGGHLDGLKGMFTSSGYDEICDNYPGLSQQSLALFRELNTALKNEQFNVPRNPFYDFIVDIGFKGTKHEVVVDCGRVTRFGTYEDQKFQFQGKLLLSSLRFVRQYDQYHDKNNKAYWTATTNWTVEKANYLWMTDKIDYSTPLNRADQNTYHLHWI